MTNVKVIKTQHPKKIEAKCQTIEGKLNPFDKTSKMTWQQAKWHIIMLKYLCCKILGNKNMFHNKYLGRWA